MTGIGRFVPVAKGCCRPEAVAPLGAHIRFFTCLHALTATALTKRLESERFKISPDKVKVAFVLNSGNRNSRFSYPRT